MINIIEHTPKWALSDEHAKDFVFLEVNGKKVCGEAGEHLEFSQSKDLDSDELNAVNNYLKSKGR